MTAARAGGADLAGAALYSTLEPCSHFGRTPPCTDAIIGAGITEVVIGIPDPDSKVSGAGIGALRAAGIEVTTGVLADEITGQLLPYLHHRSTGRPFVVLKMAVTLDGRTVAPAGERWITGEAARHRVHQLRAESDAIVVGAGTVAADDPQLTVRDAEGPSPRRIVLSHHGIDSAARVHPCTVWDGTLPGLLDTLGADGVLQLMVEGGPTVATAFHAAGLIDRYVFHVAPVISGDSAAPTVFAAAATSSVLDDNALVSATVLGDDIELILQPLKATAA
jgi:diaminohydroxyphosphoribosylaminopyrimidine deaminase/5-amino-6-(5-phosphoribosylamino)uracil reductase